MRDRKRLMVRGLLLLDPGPNRKPNTDGLLFCKEEMRCFIAERFTAAPSRGGIRWWELSHHFPESSTERSSRRRSALIPRASPEREPAAEQVRVFGAESVRGTVICSGVKIFRYLGIISGKHTMVTTVTPP